MAANINRLTAAANTAFSVVKRFTKTSVNIKINETFIKAPIKQSPTEKNEAIFAPLKLLAPRRFPTLVADANPIERGIMKKKLAIERATAWLATTTSPKGPRIIAAPENILSSTKIPIPIGIPSAISSLSVESLGNLISLKILISLNGLPF